MLPYTETGILFFRIMPRTLNVIQPVNTMCVLGILIVFFVHAESDSIKPLSSPLDAMRAAKCVLPNGPDHVTRAALLQQCLSKNYGQGNETQCFPEIGCFPMEAPWTSVLRPFPTPIHPSEINVRLYCYTRDSPERYNITLWPKISLNGFPFKADKRTVFITHGFASNGNSSWLSEMKDSYLKVVDANVCLVDWGCGAQLLNYLQVASNTRIVGAELGRFINYLIDHFGLDPCTLHLLGHSLGAHISSYAAKRVQGVSRITAMDPAQPGFEGTDKKVRLDKSDASFVEVIHTNALPFIPTLGFGLILPEGHIDFYMNGGLRQPGCHVPDVTDIKSIGDLAKFTVEVVSNLVSCSHGRAYEYYREILNKSCVIWGRQASLPRHILSAGTLGYIEPLFSNLKKCTAKSCLPLDLETPEYEARGTFVATTHNQSPFCETDPDVNKRLFSEIKEEIDDKTKKISEEVKDKVESGASVVSSFRGKIRGLLGKDKN